MEWETEGFVAQAFLPYIKHYDGSFTRPGADQRILFFEDCRRMDDITITGCAAIVERADDGWKVVDTQRAANFHHCAPVRRADGRDLLFCQSQTGAMYESLLASLFYVDFAQADGSRRTRVAKLAHNDFDIRCEDLGPPGTDSYGFWTGGLVKLELATPRVVDGNRDGRPDIALDVERRYAPWSPTMQAKLHRDCQRAVQRGDPPFISTDDLMPPPARFQLQFLGDGTKLVPAAGTQRVMKVWATQHAPRNYVW